MDSFEAAEQAAIDTLAHACAGMKSSAPAASFVLGGLLGLASSVVPRVFGLDAKPSLAAAAQAITGKQTEPEQVAALSADPTALAKFQEAAADTAARAQAAVEAERTMAIVAQLGDVASARSQTVAMAQAHSGIAWGAPAVSLVIVTGFFAALLAMMLRPPTMDAGTSAMLNVMVGALAAGLSATISYWLGSSAGSARTSELLAQSIPQSALPKPSAIVPASDVRH